MRLICLAKTKNEQHVMNTTRNNVMDLSKAKEDKLIQSLVPDNLKKKKPSIGHYAYTHPVKIQGLDCTVGMHPLPINENHPFYTDEIGKLKDGPFIVDLLVTRDRYAPEAYLYSSVDHLEFSLKKNIDAINERFDDVVVIEKDLIDYYIENAQEIRGRYNPPLDAIM